MADGVLPVLIIGAGPTGLMLARGLDEWGITYRIIDKKPGIAKEARALGVQARTLEAWQQFGLADKAVAQGAQAARVRFHSMGKLVRELLIGDVGQGLTRFPFLLFLDQPKTEALLEGGLKQSVEWNTAVDDIVVLEDHARAVLSSGEVVKARYVVGADGAHSLVRAAMNEPLEGTSRDQVFYVTDAPVGGPIEQDAISIFFSTDDFVIAFPKHGEGLLRLVGVLPTSGKDVGFDDIRRQALAASHRPLEIKEPEWLSEYRVHHRVVPRFWTGPLLLAGDAAHIHSPVGAQGMNTGLIDAHNLAFKLALILQGLGKPDLLETYHAERHGFAMRLINTTDQAFTLITAGGMGARFMRHFAIPNIARIFLRLPPLRRFAFRTVSQIGIRYKSPAKFLGKGPKPGARFPWTELEQNGAKVMSHDLIAYNSLTLLDFTAGDDTLDIGVPLTHLKVNGPKALAGKVFLIRPDMVVAYVSKGLKPAQIKAHIAEYWAKC